MQRRYPVTFGHQDIRFIPVCDHCDAIHPVLGSQRANSMILEQMIANQLIALGIEIIFFEVSVWLLNSLLWKL